MLSSYAVLLAPLLAEARPVRFVAPSSVADCKVQVTRSASPVLQTIDCGAVADLAAGSYVAWVTSGNTISERPAELAIDAGSTVVEVSLPAPSLPAGTVSIHAAAGEVVDVMQLAPPNASGWLFRVRAASGASLMMPEGPAVAIGREPGGAPRWISESIMVRAGTPNVVGPRGGDGTTLLAEIRVAPDLDIHDADESTMTLAGRKPQVWGRAADVIFAVWYDLPAERSVFAALPDTWFVPSQEAVLRASQTSWIRADAQPLPMLTVFIETENPEDITDELVIEVRTAMREKPIEHPAKVGLNEIRHVPPDKVAISLSMGRWKFSEDVDLSDGISRSVTFELKPAIVTGKVRYRSKAVRAKLRFRAAEESEISTDDSGNFRAVLWLPGFYPVAVALPDHPEVPFFHFPVRITGDRELSITIPGTAVRVRVVNARTGEPVPNAFVMVKTAWAEPVEGNRGGAFRIPTDETGEVALPPFHIGTVEVLAEAPGFAAGKPAKYTISSDTHAETFVVSLAESRAARLTVTLFDGRPAAGAIAVGYVGDRIAWTASSDSEGNIGVPEDFDGRIAVRDRAAAGTMGEWRLGTSSANWRLRPAAPPLRLRVVDSGGEPVPGARIILWTGDIPIAGSALSFLYDATPSTSGDGTWTAHGLPAPEVRILALSPRSMNGPQPQMTFATLVRLPWPALTTIRVLD